MPARPGRKALHVYLTDEAHQWWHETSYDHGVTVSALIEALAQRNTGITKSVAETARNIDSQRRRRR